MGESKEVSGMAQLKAFLSGGVGGICLVAVGHPLDLLKVRIQASKEKTTLMKVGKDLLKRDGIRGFYRGMASPLLGAIPVCAASFWGYEAGLQLFSYASRVVSQNKKERELKGEGEEGEGEGEGERERREREGEGGEREGGKRGGLVVGGLGAILFAGWFSSFPIATVLVPTERVKILMQIDGQREKKTFSSPSQCARTIFRTEGIRGMYKGTVATLARDGPGYLAYFATYEMIRHQLSLRRSSSSSSSSSEEMSDYLIAGGFAGIAAWLVCLPPDTIKSRIQMRAVGQRPKSVRNAVLDLYRAEGTKGFYKGLGPALLRAFPSNAACFFGMELSRNFLTLLL